MNSVNFFDVRKRAKVDVPVEKCWKTKYERKTKAGGTQVRYAVKAEVDGAKLTKFVSKDTWEGLSCPAR